MLKRFELKNFPAVDCLHDCETSFTELLDNKLIFNFDKKGLDILLPNGERMFPFDTLKVSYVLNSAFVDESPFFAVRHINQRKFLRKKAIEFWTLKKLISYLNENKSNLRIYGQYFDRTTCVIITELINKHGWQMGNEFDLELLVDEIIYEGN